MNNNYDNHDKGSYPPWSRIPSFIEMTAEIGVDHDLFIHLIEKGETIEAIANQMEISEKTVESLYEHFMRYGISSVIGGD